MRLGSALKQPIADAITKIVDLLDQTGRAPVSRIHEVVFPLATTTRSRNSSLKHVADTFNSAAANAGHHVRICLTETAGLATAARWAWFEGLAQGPRSQPTPGLSAVPTERLVSGQRGLPLDPVVVLLTVNENETRAVLQEFLGDRAPETSSRGAVTYNLLGWVGNLRVVHVVCEQGSGSVGGSLSRVKASIDSWCPRAVIAVGIAFGMNSDKQQIGDVLVSEHIITYELARVNTDGTITPRGSKPDASPSLLNRIRTLDQSTPARDLIEWPLLRYGTLLSGEKLVDNIDYRDSLRRLYELEAIGGEMEAAGLYVASLESHVDWIVVKAISDWADGRKALDKLARQQLAARNAALVVRRALDCHGLLDSSAADTTASAWSSGQPSRGTDDRGGAPDPESMGLADVGSVADRLVTQPLGLRTTLHKDRIENTASSEATGVDVLEYIVDWLREPSAPPVFALLGEYGMGKTITCQRLVRLLSEQHPREPALPVPLYFDLRHVTGLREGVPTLKGTIEECVRRGWHASDGAFGFADFERLVDQGAVVILDGLDEVLVKLNEPDGQAYTNQLIKLLFDSRERRVRANDTTTGSEPRLLISCRSQYFRTLRDQRTHFTGQERGEYGPEACRALVLLPFSQEQVRQYLRMAIPSTDPDRVLEMIRSVHDLSDLTRRPYSLKLVADSFPQIAADPALGHSVSGLTLYRRLVMSWLDRDKGKHHIHPEHKLRLAAHLGAEMSRYGRNILPVSELESWLHRWLEEQPDLRSRYARVHPDQLEEDLRTASFLVRHDAPREADCGFRFAHSSLQEYFLADYLLQALRENRPERWAHPRYSLETLDFLGQMLQELGRDSTELLATLQHWRHSYRVGTSELLLAYTLQGRRKEWPVPILHGIDLRGARLKGWMIGEPEDCREGSALELGPATFAGADLRQTRFYHVRLEAANFTAALLERAEFHNCTLRGARFDGSAANGSKFRGCQLEATGWEGAAAWRAQFVKGAPEVLPPMSVAAPAVGEALPARLRLALLNGHTGSVSFSAFSRDGARLLSAGYDGTLRLWDVASGDHLRVLFHHEGYERTCAISPDGARILAGGRDGTLHLCDIASGDVLWVRACNGAEGVSSCTFSPDGTRVLAGCTDGKLCLWDAASGEPLPAPPCHQAGRVGASAFSLDGERFVSGYPDGTIRLSDVATGGALWVRSCHPRGGVWSCAISPDGTRVLTGGGAGELRLWDATNGKFLRSLTGHEDKVLTCSFSPDGRRVASGDAKSTLYLWDAASGEMQWRSALPSRGRSRCCAFSSDGALLVSAGDDATIRILDAADGEILRGFSRQEGWLWHCFFSPDGTRLFSGGADGILRQWDAVSGKAMWVQSCQLPQDYWHATLSPDGSRIVSGGADGRLRILDAASGKLLWDQSVPGAAIECCAFSPDGAQLLSGGDDGMLRLWDATSGEPSAAFLGHLSRIDFCAFSPDSRQLLSTAADGAIRLWDAASRGPLRLLSESGPRHWQCAFSPDGHRILSGASDGSLRLWDATNGEVLWTRSSYTKASVLSCAFAPDGTRALSGDQDGALRLWDVTNGKPLALFLGHAGGVRSCVFSPNGAQLLSAAYDGTLRLWDSATGDCLRIHASLGDGHAVWEPGPSRLIEATGDAWRWLRWQGWVEGDGWMPFPLESLGAVPSP